MREKCIYEGVGEKDNVRFFNYLFNVRLACLQVQKQITKECAEEQITKLGIDLEYVNWCMDTSFDTAGDYTSYNEILDEDRESATLLGVQTNPTVAINGHIYHGSMDPN